MKINWILIGVVFFNLLFSTIGDVLAKYWGLTNNNKYIYIAMFVGLFTSFFYFCIVKYGDLTIATTITLLLTIIISVALGYLYFGEPVKLVQWVGIFLSFIAILLMLNIFEK